GQSDTFNFFNVAVNGGFDTGTVDVTADLGFILPESVVVSGTGTGEYFTFFGIVSGGMLTWAEPDPVLLSDGSGFSVNLSDIRAFGFGNSAEVTATVVADLVVAPEPATLPLLGIGLFAVAVLAWRRRGTVRA
ncbi:MAG: PEP-CTERM sorting domain-containing protein, partial [Bryobacteraceae bacterium]